MFLKPIVENQEGGNTTELDAVLRSHIVKHWKNGKFYVVLRNFRSITTLLSYGDPKKLKFRRRTSGGPCQSIVGYDVNVFERHRWAIKNNKHCKSIVNLYRRRLMMLKLMLIIRTSFCDD